MLQHVLYQKSVHLTHIIKRIISPNYAQRTVYLLGTELFSLLYKYTMMWSLCSCDRASWAKREERIPTRRNNIDDLLSIPDVDYWLKSRHVSGIFMPIIRRKVHVLLHMGFLLLVLDVAVCGAVVLHCRVWALWRLLLDCSQAATFTVLTPYKRSTTAPQPATSNTTS